MADVRISFGPLRSLLMLPMPTLKITAQISQDSVIEFQDSSSENPFGEPELSRPSPKRNGWLSGVSDTLQVNFLPYSSQPSPAVSRKMPPLHRTAFQQPIFAGYHTSCG